MALSEAAKAKKKEYARKRYHENREEMLAKQRKYHAEHKEEQNRKQRERDRARREKHNEKQRERYWARREELLARRREQRKAQKAKLTGKLALHERRMPDRRKHWVPVAGWEERYLAEEIGKYGPIIEDEPLWDADELLELRERIFAALDGKEVVS